MFDFVPMLSTTEKARVMEHDCPDLGGFMISSLCGVPERARGM